MKQAEDFGFRAGGDPKRNAEALQAAVRGGGEITVTAPGIYDLNETVFLESHTCLRLGTGVILRRVAGEGHIYGYTFVNRGAYTATEDEDIQVIGLCLQCNGQDMRMQAEHLIPGLFGHVSFFYVKDLVIRDFTCLDLMTGGFAIHVCTFRHILVEHVHIEGRKDGVHLGRGRDFVIRHGKFRTFDDPIALNAHDYAISNPQLGWIEDGLIEDCYDLDDDTTTGFFCRILAGAWSDWRRGMEVQNSDTVVSNGRLYRVLEKADGTVYTSVTQPTHTEGTAVLDGIHWVMVQEDVIYNCGCRNIRFKDIHLQKHRSIAFSIHFDDDKWSRSVYPDASMPIQEELLFENIYVENEIQTLLSTVSPVDRVEFKHCELANARVIFHSLPRKGLQYPTSKLLFTDTHFRSGADAWVQSAVNRKTELTVQGCTAEEGFSVIHYGNVQVEASDLPTKEYQE